MAGSSNFQQWNPGAVNQENDAAYTADSLRSGGAPTDAILASRLFNKAAYQWSTFIAAFTASMALKGYVLSDVDLGNLTTVLANVLTVADIFPLNLVQTLSRKSDFPNHTGTVSEDILWSFVLPAGRANVTSIIRIYVRWNNTLVGGGGSDNVIRLKLNGVSSTIGPSISNQAPGECELQFDILCTGSLVSPVLLTRNTNEGIGSGSTVTLVNRGIYPGVNLTAATTITFSVQATNAANQFQIETELIQIF